MSLYVALAVIALGVTMVVAGASGSGLNLFQAVTGRSIPTASGSTSTSTSGGTGTNITPQGNGFQSGQVLGA